MHEHYLKKVQALLDHYGLSKNVFTDEAIVETARFRNAIAHPFEGEEKEDLWPKILFVRELVSQIMFHEIGYTDAYESYYPSYKSIHPQHQASSNPE